MQQQQPAFEDAATSADALCTAAPQPSGHDTAAQYSDVGRLTRIRSGSTG